MELNEVVEKIESFDSNHIVFTWWEPALFQEHIKAILDKLESPDSGKYTEYFSEIETNGSIELDPILFDQVNVSYKSKSSGNNYPLVAIDVGYDYKFVIWSQDDLDEMEDSQSRMDIADYCLKRGYRYAPRQHIAWFGNKRWV